MFKVGVISEAKPGYCKVHFPTNDIVSDWLPIAYQGTMAYKDHHPYEVQQQVVCLMDENCEDGCIIGATYNDEDTPPTEANATTWVKKFKDGTVLTYDSSSKELKVKAEGKVTVDAKDDVVVKSLKDVNCEGVNVKGKASTKATVEAPSIDLKGNVVVTGTLSVSGVLTAPSATIAGAVNAATVIAATSVAAPTVAAGGISVSGAVTGNLTMSGDLITTGDVVAGGKSLKTHVHGGVQSGGGTTGTPI
jgi:phage baseplate assembly protein V